MGGPRKSELERLKVYYEWIARPLRRKRGKR